MAYGGCRVRDEPLSCDVVVFGMCAGGARRRERASHVVAWEALLRCAVARTAT